MIWSLIFGFLIHPVYAREVKLPDINLESQNIERLVISGIKVQVKLSSSASGRISIHIKKNQDDKDSGSEDLNPILFREDKILRLELRHEARPQEVQAYIPVNYTPNDYRSKTEFIYEIEAPDSMPFELNGRELKLSAQNRSALVKLVGLDSKVNLSKNKGLIWIQSPYGEFTLDENRSKVEIETLKAKVHIEDQEADVRLRNFAGDTKLQNIKANLSTNTHLGSLNANKISGNVDFENDKASLNWVDVGGSIRGQTEDGNVFAKLTGEPNISVDAISALVQVKLSGKGGGSFRLQTEEGQLQGPANNNLAKKGLAKVMTGKLSGEGAGIVSLKSKTGNLILKD